MESNFSQQIDSPDSEKSAGRQFDLPERYTVSKTVKNQNFVGKEDQTEVKKRQKSPTIKNVQPDEKPVFKLEDRLNLDGEGSAQTVRSM